MAAARGQRPEPVDDATWQASLLLVRGMTQERIFGLGQQLLERLARNGPLVPVNLHLHLPPEIAAALRGYVEAARRELTARAHAPALEEIQRPSARMAAIFVQRGERVPEWVAYLALLEECACVWDPPAQGRRSRTARTLERDGYRCMAPGCTARSQLQVHHVRYRSAGGGDEPENLLTLCMHHHQYGEHGGLGHCRGRAPLDVIWCVGSGEHATWWRNERRLQAPP